MPGTKFDRFYIESIQPRIRTIDKVQPIIDFLNSQEVNCSK